MTLHRITLCACGHGREHHGDGGKGPCTYGHSTPTGGCTWCEGFKKRRAGGKGAPAAEPKTLEEVSALFGGRLPPGSPPSAAPAIALEELVDIVARFAHAVDRFGVLVGAFGSVLATTPAVKALPQVPVTFDPKAGERTAPAARRKRESKAAPAGETTLRKGERKLVEVLARHHPARLTRTQLATLAGFAPSGGTFGTYLSVLRRAELLDEDSSGIAVTSAGIRASGLGATRPMTRAEIVETWRGTLRAGERTMLDVVLQRGELAREDLAGFSGLTANAGTFGTYLSVLRRNGLVDVDKGTVRLGKALSEAR